MHDGFSYDPPSRAVATWDVVTPARECSTRIPGLRRGEYTLVLEPIALRRRVEVGAGTTSVRFEVGELAELTIRAVDESGRGAGDAGKLGALLWRVVEDAGPDLTQAFVLGPETGVPSFANVDAGAWRITTLAHREILVRLCGPDSIDAADLRIVPPAGPSEHELRVRGR
jgi:hypothetical protein